MGSLWLDFYRRSGYGLRLPYKQANDIIRRDLENFTNIIADKAKEHKFTIMMGVPTVCTLSLQPLVLNWRLGTAK